LGKAVTPDANEDADMNTQNIINIISDFFANFDEEFDGNWADALDIHLERMGVEVADATANEKSDGEFLVAIGDQAFFRDYRREIIALDREVEVVIVAEGHSRPYWTGCGWSSLREQAEEYLARDLPVSIEDHEGATIDLTEVDGYHAYAAPGADGAYAYTVRD
jgi:hypothetical protein